MATQISAPHVGRLEQRAAIRRRLRLVNRTAPAEPRLDRYYDRQSAQDSAAICGGLFFVTLWLSTGILIGYSLMTVFGWALGL